MTDKMKRIFFQEVIVSILLYGCTTWTLTKQMEKKLDGNYTRMLRAILNRSWRQHPTKHQLYGHLQPITKTIQVRRTRNAGHCWRSRDELIRDVILWTPSHGRVKSRVTRSNLHTAVLWGYGVQPWGPAGCNVRLGGVARGDQGYPRWWYDKMMMMMIYRYLIELCLMNCTSLYRTDKLISILSVVW